MRGLLLAIMALALCAGAPATAQNRSDCPVASDLQKGIRLTRAKPLFDMTLRKKGAVVTEDRTMIDRTGKRRRVKTTLLDGLVPLVRQEGQQVIRQKLLNGNRPFVANGQVRNWSGPVEIRVGNRVFGTGTIQVRRVGRATWTGNGCTYKVTRVIVTSKIKGRPDSSFEYYYAPALGVSLGAFKLGSDGRTRINNILPERISKR